MKVFIGESKNYTSFALLQTAYRAQYGAEISSNDIDRKQTGKPYFRDREMPFYNISHSGEYIACVFDEKEIGLDIQKIKKIPKRLVSRYLHTNSENPVQQIVEWTKLESYGKQKGTGIPPADDYEQGEYLCTLELTGYIITVCLERGRKQALELVFI